MKPEDAQLLEILIDGDNTDRERQTRDGAGESESLLASLPDRSAASFTTGQGSLTQPGSSKKGILKKGEALRRASAAADLPVASGVHSKHLLCYMPFHLYHPVHLVFIA